MLLNFPYINRNTIPNEMTRPRFGINAATATVIRQEFILFYFLNNRYALKTE